MSFKGLAKTSPLLKYVLDHSLRSTKEQLDLVEVTQKHPESIMLGSQDVLQLTSNLIKCIKGKKVLDVGVFTGSSALSAALAIPDDGIVFGLDVCEDFYKIGEPYWKAAGVDHKIKMKIGPALDSLQKLIDDGQTGTFDFAFIDADKKNYSNYYELCLNLIRPGGIIAVDNTIWFSKVIDESDQTESTVSIRALNDKLKDDQRINISYLTIGDGVTLCFKK